MSSTKTKARSQTKEVTLRFFNSKSKELSFILEPWGDILDFEPEDEIVVVFVGPDEEDPEIDVGDDAVTAYGWTGSFASVFKNGVEVRAGLPD